MRAHMQGVHHFALSVPDIAIARRFYIDLLGAEEISGGEWEAGNPWIDAIVGLENSAAKTFIARLKNVQVEIFEYTSPRSPDADPMRPVNLYGYTHVGFQVDDIMATYEKMLAAGLTFHTAPDMTTIVTDEHGNKTGFAATYGRDFFGNVFEILEIHANDTILPVAV
ncbi:VOC family protein [Croceicoccus sp. BE223]|uniref:VOC family protein n=1 Tax=Croceicoccus sp. BE223 TaxID=2817716 RepID=UPI0028553452|nr:VOC family protein [Croceicoccus sp. BE223]MDR7101973.1 catechol 2,3-dioxygenase-like lactoylglutathione lyase family enzyme [Croceicoccus sp. BE223]